MSEERPDDIVGHKTLRGDGPLSFRHEPLTRAEAEEFMVAADKERSERVALMPDERAAINLFFQAWLRLTELGWKEATYCPKDGTSFDTIEAGSTGIHRAHYSGDWPDGTWWVEDAGDLWPSRPTLFRLDPEAEAERKTKMREAARRYREETAATESPQP